MSKDKDKNKSHPAEDENAASKQERDDLARQLETRTKERDELHGMLTALQKEKDEIFGKLQRISADYANYQKRVPKQIADEVAYEKERLIKALLPILDNFERTLHESHTAETVDAVLQGVQVVHDHLLNLLRSLGIEQMNPVGDTFDPAQHEAVTYREDTEKEDLTVLDVHQKGYRMDRRVLRPARVCVNKIASKPARIPEPPGAENAVDEGGPKGDDKPSNTE
jgi:molecular chaperone GrpE